MSAHHEPGVQEDVDVTVMAFAQWLSENRSRTQNNIQQLLAEMGIIRNGITANNSDLMEFKRHSAQVQQQQQREIGELREKVGQQREIGGRRAEGEEKVGQQHFDLGLLGNVYEWDILG